MIEGGRAPLRMTLPDWGADLDADETQDRRAGRRGPDPHRIARDDPEHQRRAPRAGVSPDQVAPGQPPAQTTRVYGEDVHRHMTAGEVDPSQRPATRGAATGATGPGQGGERQRERQPARRLATPR